MVADREQLAKRTADGLAPVMFYLSLAFLMLTAALLVLWIDVPRVVETIEEVEISTGSEGSAKILTGQEVFFESSAVWWGYFCIAVLLAIWPIFIAEQIYYFVISRDRKKFFRSHPYWYLFCLVPPLRMCAKDREDGGKIWLPILGWQEPNYAFQKQLERQTSITMIGVALLILPVLGLEFMFGHIGEYPALRILLHVGTGVIWFAFAVEFILMVSVTDNKIKYCKKHWLDLVIILLPLISFLRTLRLLRASKLAKIGKIQQLTKMVRVYRLRGVSMRAFRALMLLEVLNRILRVSPERRIESLENQYEEKKRELDLLREEIDSLKSRYQQTAKIDRSNVEPSS